MKALVSLFCAEECVCELLTNGSLRQLQLEGNPAPSTKILGGEDKTQRSCVEEAARQFCFSMHFSDKDATDGRRYLLPLDMFHMKEV